MAVQNQPIGSSRTRCALTASHSLFECMPSFWPYLAKKSSNLRQKDLNQHSPAYRLSIPCANLNV